MMVVLNGKTVSCEEGTTLLELLKERDIDLSNLAIAVDDVVISRSEWEHFSLKNNAGILLIKATQGG